LSAEMKLSIYNLYKILHYNLLFFFYTKT